MFGPGWTWNRKDENTMKDVVRNRVIDFIKAGYSVIIDNTNLSRGVREMWKQLAFSLGADYEEHEMSTDLQECIYRDSKREGKARVGRAVIERMALFYGFIDWSQYDGEFVIVDLDGTVANCQHRLGFLEPKIAHKLDCTAGCKCGHLDDGLGHPKGCAQRHMDEYKFCPRCYAKAKKDWQAFHADENIAKDEPYPAIVRLVKEYFLVGYHVLYVTGRGTESGIATEDWLNKHELLDGEWMQHLFMRPAGDHRPDTEIKREILDLLPKDRIAYVLEDRDRVVEMYRAEGLTVLQPKKGDY